MSLPPDVEAELEAALAPLRAQDPSLSNAEAAKLLPKRLADALWDRALDRYFAGALGPEHPDYRAARQALKNADEGERP